MLIYKNPELEKYKTDNLEIRPEWSERNFVKGIKAYLEGDAGYILAVNGLPGTGKTVGILQAAEGFEIAYLIAQRHDGRTGRDYISFIKSTDKRYIVMDNYSWIEDRQPLDECLSSLVQEGRHIILATGEFFTPYWLNNNVRIINTNVFTYEEYLELFDRKHGMVAYADYLTEGGMFKDCILKNLYCTKEYIKSSIVQGLIDYSGNGMDEEKAEILTYSVLYRAVAPFSLSSVPALHESTVTLEDFLKLMGINSGYMPNGHEIDRTADIFEREMIIVRTSGSSDNCNHTERYYITNPSMAYQLIRGTYDIRDIKDQILEYLYEESIAIKTTGRQQLLSLE